MCFGLAACAQSNALFDGTTGSLLGESPGIAEQSTPGHPPLPARRKAKAEPEDGAASSLLSALPGIDLSAPAVAPASVVTQERPIDVYVRVARQIRRCWLGADNPKLPDHDFRAEAKPGDAGEAEIDIFKKVPGRKLGPFAFEVKISPRAGGALVRSRNRRLDDKLVNDLRTDIARWTRGGTDCAAPGEKNA